MIKVLSLTAAAGLAAVLLTVPPAESSPRKTPGVTQEQITDLSAHRRKRYRAARVYRHRVVRPYRRYARPHYRYRYVRRYPAYRYAYRPYYYSYAPYYYYRPRPYVYISPFPGYFGAGFW